MGGQGFGFPSEFSSPRVDFRCPLPAQLNGVEDLVLWCFIFLWPGCRCLVHIVRSTSLKYSKIRQFQEHFQFDVCRHEVRYGCLREDSCHFAHSFIELKVWLLQQYSGGCDLVQAWSYVHWFPPVCALGQLS